MTKQFRVGELVEVENQIEGQPPRKGVVREVRNNMVLVWIDNPHGKGEEVWCDYSEVR